MVGTESFSASRDIMLVFVLLALYAAGFQMISPVLPRLIEQLSEDRQAFGTLQGAFGLVQVVGGFITGPLIDMYGARRLLIINFVASAVCYSLYLAASSMMWLYLAQIPTLFQHGMLAGRAFIAIQTRDDSLRRLLLGYVSIAYSVGMIFGPLLGGYLTTAYPGPDGEVNVRAPILAAAGLAVVSLLLTFLLREASADVTAITVAASPATILRASQGTANGGGGSSSSSSSSSGAAWISADSLTSSGSGAPAAPLLRRVSSDSDTPHSVDAGTPSGGVAGTNGYSALSPLPGSGSSPSSSSSSSSSSAVAAELATLIDRRSLSERLQDSLRLVRSNPVVRSLFTLRTMLLVPAAMFRASIALTLKEHFHMEPSSIGRMLTFVGLSTAVSQLLVVPAVQRFQKTGSLLLALQPWRSTASEPAPGVNVVDGNAGSHNAAAGLRRAPAASPTPPPATDSVGPGVAVGVGSGVFVSDTTLVIGATGLLAVAFGALVFATTPLHLYVAVGFMIVVSSVINTIVEGNLVAAAPRARGTITSMNMTVFSLAGMVLGPASTALVLNQGFPTLGAVCSGVVVLAFLLLQAGALQCEVPAGELVAVKLRTD